MKDVRFISHFCKNIAGKRKKACCRGMFILMHRFSGYSSLPQKSGWLQECEAADHIVPTNKETGDRKWGQNTVPSGTLLL